MPTNQKIDWTKPVQTRDGHTARVLCTDAKGEYPIIALVRDGDYERVDRFLADGREFAGGLPCGGDLVNVPPLRKTYYVNWYADGDVYKGVESREKADRAAHSSRIAVLHVTTENDVPVTVEIEHLKNS